MLSHTNFVGKSISQDKSGNIENKRDNNQNTNRSLLNFNQNNTQNNNNQNFIANSDILELLKHKEKLRKKVNLTFYEQF